MKTTTTHTKDVWASGDFAGDERRPTARATIQRMYASHPQYRLDQDRSIDWQHSGTYTSLLFGNNHAKPRELYNVRSVKWERGVEMDVGTCTIVLGNVEARNSSDPVSDSELDFPGFYTPNRGREDYFDEWGYVTNAWRGWIQPDRIIRTYEGYGVDLTVAPEHDDHLYPSGTWLVDDVEIDTKGLITLTCRDFARVLLDQIIFPTVIPYGVYPLWFDKHEDRGKQQKVVTPDDDSEWITPAYSSDSNKYYASHPEIRDKPTRDLPLRPIVAADRTVYGHHPRDAFDPATYTRWVSTGFKSKTQRDAYVWIEGKLASPSYVEGVKIDAQHGAYRCYISVQNADGDWLGNKRVPYKADNVDAHADIKYVKEFKVAKGETLTVKLPKRYANIKKIRYTFSVAWVGFGVKYPYHAQINKVYYADNVELSDQAGTWKHGNYTDYTDIVKWLLCWGGWYWPSAESGLNEQIYSDGSTYTLDPPSNDSVLVNGRAWGDFETTGTNGLVKFDVDTWDKKPLMDGIGVIRDITGFDFWVDETGGAIWRLPNIWDKGCYIMPEKGGVRATRTESLVTIDERQHLIDQAVKLSSRNVRERVYVANYAGNIGAVVRGYRPVGTGLKRHAGWTDQHFKTADECERMADLIALKQSFSYRQNQLTITGNPSIQPDDQVIIRERITGEGYIHRVLGISSDFDNDTGQWTYSLTTNWLGTEAFTDLAWNPLYLTNPTKAYLYHMGHLASP